MNKKEEDAMLHLVLSISLVCGNLACTISDDPDHVKWLAVTAEQTRNDLIKAQNKYLEDSGFMRDE